MKCERDSMKTNKYLIEKDQSARATEMVFEARGVA